MQNNAGQKTKKQVAGRYRRPEKDSAFSGNHPQEKN
jgi:hypothetical protein